MNTQDNWLVHDHQRYDALLDDCEVAAGAGDWDGAVNIFNIFFEELKIHMRVEDEILYPLIEEYYHDPEGEMTELKEEHDDIERLVHDLVHVIKYKNIEHFEQSLQPVHEALKQHNNHEEAVFAASNSEYLLMRRDEILARIAMQKEDKKQRKWWLF
jgi:hypothetical protein